MRNCLLKVYTKALMLAQGLKEESGQDLIEYALVVALVAFAATAGMGKLATGINLAFSNIALQLNTTIT
jgi:pilus assembly protein Flp/PilA